MRKVNERAKEILESMALQQRIIMNSYERYAKQPNTITGLIELERIEKRSKRFDSQAAKLAEMLDKEYAK